MVTSWRRSTTMARSAAQVRVTAVAAAPRPTAEIIDFRTRRPWRRDESPSWSFLADVAITFTLVLLGAWPFLKMQGG
jgi:hypothetical protein